MNLEIRSGTIFCTLLLTVTFAAAALADDEFNKNDSAMDTSKLSEPVVKDSNGRAVGIYLFLDPLSSGIAEFSGDYVFIRTPKVSFATPISANVLGGNNNPGTSALFGLVWFTNSQCTGTPYLAFPRNAAPVTPFAVIVGHRAYVTTAQPSSVVVNSYVASNAPLAGNTPGACYEYPPTTLSLATGSNGFMVTATVDLSSLNFLPPYSVQ